MCVSLGVPVLLGSSDEVQTELSLKFVLSAGHYCTYTSYAVQVQAVGSDCDVTASDKVVRDTHNQ